MAESPQDAPDWGARAERILERALSRLRDGHDVIGDVDLALVVLRIQAGDMPADELAGYTFPGEEPEPECTCPPGLLERGGFRGGCPVHSSLAVIPEREQ